MNRLFYYMDGDYKRTPNPRNRTRKNVMNNPDRIKQVILITLIGLLSLYSLLYLISSTNLDISTTFVCSCGSMSR